MPCKYRKCEICREWIEPERFYDSETDKYHSETVLCRKHANEIEHFGGEFITESKEDRSSKPGSLKHNVAGVTTRMVRNTRAMEDLRRLYEEESTV